MQTILNSVMRIQHFLILFSLLALVGCPESDECKDKDGDGLVSPLVVSDAGAEIDPICRRMYTSSTDSAEQCLVLLDDCDDSSSFTFYCELGACWCLQDATVTYEAAIEGACPKTVEELARVCEWDVLGGSSTARRSN